MTKYKYTTETSKYHVLIQANILITQLEDEEVKIPFSSYDNLYLFLS